LEGISNVSTGADRGAVLDRLQGLCVEGVGDVDFAIWVQLQWFAAAVEGWRSYQEALDASLPIVKRFPEDVNVLTNAAGAAVEAQALERAEELAERAAKIDSLDFGVSRVFGNIAWSRREPASALQRYRAAAREEPASVPPAGRRRKFPLSYRCGRHPHLVGVGPAKGRRSQGGDRAPLAPECDESRPEVGMGKRLGDPVKGPCVHASARRHPVLTAQPGAQRGVPGEEFFPL